MWKVFLIILFVFSAYKSISQPLGAESSDTSVVDSSAMLDSISLFTAYQLFYPQYFILPETHDRYYPFPSLMDPHLAEKWPVLYELRKDGSPLVRNTDKDFLLGFLTILALTLVTGLRMFPDALMPISWFTKKPSTYEERSRDDVSPVHLLFNLLFFCVLGLIIWFAYHHLLSYSSTPHQIPYFILLVAIVYGVKSIFYRSTGLLFGFKDTLIAYLQVVFKINRCLAVLLLPLVFWMIFSSPFWAKWALFCALGTISLFLGLRFYRGMQLSSKLISNRIHFLFYLCASELLPTLVLIKFLLNE